jgi:GT2 family glycosyltransferase
MSENLELSVIILNYNGEGYTKNCLDSIFSNSDGVNFEVIMIDNASTDSSLDIVKRNFSQVRIIENSINYGYAKGNNIGIRQSHGEFCLILNSDTELLPNALREALDFVRHSPPLTIVCAKVLNFDGTPQINCRRFPKLLTEYLKHAFYKIKFIDNPLSRRQVIRTWERDEVQKVDWATGCFLLTRKKDIEKIGLFDDNFFLLYEDVDLCLRFHQAGGQTVYYPFSIIKHKGGGILCNPEIVSQSNLYGFQSAVYYFRKHHGKIQAAILHWLTKITWIINLILLSFMDILSFFRIPEIRKKEKMLTYMLTRYKNLT